MVMSTVEVRAHSIRLGGQEQASIMPTRSADSSSTIKPRQFKFRLTPRQPILFQAFN